MIGVDFQNPIVCDDSLTSLFAFLIENAEVVPNLTAVWLDVLSFKNSVECISILIL